MENASNALIMAGGILIAILVLSLAVYLFVNYAKIGESYEQTRQTDEIVKFNTKFTIFTEREDITAQEIISLANYVKNYNKENDSDIKVYVDSIDYAKKGDSDCITFIKHNSISDDGEYIYFTCKESDLKTSSETGKVTEIKFNKKTT